jgi:hypothetical protein
MNIQSEVLFKGQEAMYNEFVLLDTTALQTILATYGKDELEHIVASQVLQERDAEMAAI